MIGLVMLLIVAGVAGSQSASSDQEADSRPRCGLLDRSSHGLTWAAKDNGKDVSWKNAVNTAAISV